MKIKCPACSKVLSIPESAAGKVVKCPCGKQLRAPGGAPASAKPAQAPGKPKRPTPARPAAGPAKPRPAQKPVAPAPVTPAASVADLFDELSEGDYQPVAAVVQPGKKAPPPRTSGETRKLLEQNDPDAAKRKGKSRGKANKASKKGGGRSRSTSYSSAPLASPWIRLGAAIIDGVIINIVLTASAAIGAAIGVAASGDAISKAQNQELSDAEAQAAATEIGMQIIMSYGLAMLVGIIVVALIYGVMMVKTGKTIGKMACGIRVVDSDSREIPSFMQGVLLRSWVTNLLNVVPFFALIDQVMIFGEGSQCLHDKMANTVVIKS